MVEEETVDESESVLSEEGLQFPVHVTMGVLEEPGDVLESSVPLSIVTGLLSVQNEFGEVTVGLLGQSSAGWIKVRGDRWVSVTYLPIMSARSLMLGTPQWRPSIPVRRCLK